jgi:hypothetical protein
VDRHIRGRRRARQHGGGERGERGRGLDARPALACDERESRVVGPGPDDGSPVGHERAQARPARADRAQAEPGGLLDPFQREGDVQLVGAGVAGLGGGLVGGRHEQVVALDLVVEVLGDLADHGAAQPGAVGHPGHGDRPSVGLQADARHARAVGDDIGPRPRRVDDQAGGDVADPPAGAVAADVAGGRRRPHDTAPGLQAPHVCLV